MKAPLLARTPAEAHLYMDLHPCSCGEHRFPRQHATAFDVDNETLSRYSGACARCGAPRRFVFRGPQWPLPPDPSGVTYGADDPSQLLDAGEWLEVADRHAARGTRRDLAVAAAAVTEVLKFVPPGDDRVPLGGFRTDRGRAVYAAEPGRFSVARLRAVRDVYARAAT